MILSIIFGVIALLCLGYYSFAASYAGIHSAFLWFWLLAGIGCAILAVGSVIVIKHNLLEVVPKWIKITVIAVVACGIALFLFLEGCVISKMNAKPADDAEYVIVLGAQVRGSKITKSLAKRLDAAYEYGCENTTCKIIVSGGQGVGEDLPEAEAMKKYLIEKGIDENRIIEENKSTTTKENLVFSMKIINDFDASVVIITNNFHVFRATRLAKKIGYTNISAKAAKSDNHLIINYMVRESLAMVKEKMLGNI